MTEPRVKRARSGPVLSYSIRLLGAGILILIASTVFVVLTFEQPHGPLCASDTQRAQVRRLLEETPSAGVDDLAKRLKSPPAIVLDAFPSEQRVGVEGNALGIVWDLLTRWPRAVVVLQRAGQIFEVHAPIEATRPVSGLRVLNFGTNTTVLSGHLRPEHIGAIYAFLAKSDDRLVPVGVLFFNRQGELAFQISPVGNPRDAPGGISEHFTATVSEMRKLNPICEAADG